MKNILLSAAVIILTALCLYLFLRGPRVETVETVRWRDSIVIVRPDPIVVERIRWRDRPIDTLAILDDYFSKKAFQETAPIPGLGDVTVNFEIFANALEKMTLDWDFSYEIPRKRNTIALQTDFRRVNMLYSRDIGRGWSITGGISSRGEILIGIGLSF